MLLPVHCFGSGMMMILLVLCSGFCRHAEIYLKQNHCLHLTLFTLETIFWKNNLLASMKLPVDRSAVFLWLEICCHNLQCKGSYCYFKVSICIPITSHDLLGISWWRNFFFGWVCWKSRCIEQFCFMIFNVCIHTYPINRLVCQEFRFFSAHMIYM